MAYPLVPSTEAFLAAYDPALDQSFQEGAAGASLTLDELMKYFKLSTTQKAVVRRTFLLAAGAYFQASGGVVGGLSIGTFSNTGVTNGLDLTGTVLTLHAATSSTPGGVSTGTQTFAGDKTFLGNISAANLSGTNTGDVTLLPFGNTPNANGATIAFQQLQLMPANASNPGGVSIIGQVFSSGTGTKRFQNNTASDLPITVQNGNSSGVSGISFLDVSGTGQGSLGWNNSANIFTINSIFNPMQFGNGFAQIYLDPNTNVAINQRLYVGLGVPVGLLPSTLNVAGTSALNGNTTIGGTTTGAGLIWSTSGGFKFPDNTIQTTAAVGTADVTLTASGTSPNAEAATLVGQQLQLQQGDGTFAGLMSPANYTKLVGLANITTIGTGLNLTTGTLTATGLLSVGTFGSTPNSSGASVSSGVLTLQPADASNPGGVSTGTQSFAGNKTFTGTIAASNLSGTNTGDVTLAAIGAVPNANAASLSGQILTLQPASGSFGGVVTTGTQTFAGNKTFSGTISASNLSGTNTGDVTLSAFGSAPNANGASLSGQALTLQPADASNPGGVTTSAQTFAGDKTTSSWIGSNANVNTTTSPSPQISLVATGASGIPLMLFTGNSTVRGHIWAGTTGNMAYNAVGGSHVWFNNGTAAMGMTPTEFRPNAASGLTLGTAALPWGQTWATTRVNSTSANTGFAIGSTTAQFEAVSTAALGVAVLGFTTNGAQRGLIGVNQSGNMVFDATNDTLFRRNATTHLTIGQGTVTTSGKTIYTTSTMTGNGSTQGAGQVPSVTDTNGSYTVTNGAGNNAITLPSGAAVGTVIFLTWTAATGSLFPHSGGQINAGGTNAVYGTSQNKCMMCLRVSSTLWAAWQTP